MPNLDTQLIPLRVIPSFPNYAAGEDGEIYRITKPRDRKNFDHPYLIKREKSGSHKYFMVSLFNPEGERKRCSIHRLVAEAWIGPCPEGKEVNHKNLNKADCRPSNLEYATKLGNTKHAIENGRIELKLTDAEVLAIQRSNHSQRYLAEVYNVSRSLIHLVRHGQRRLWGR